MNSQRTTTPGVVVILGMHRSGTSCLAGCLQKAGLYLGDVNEQAAYNARGNRENRAIMDLNDAILMANGGSWYEPPDTVVWNSEHKARRDELIGAYPSHITWGFKDPRTLQTLDGWLEALPSVRCVGTFRNPLDVARSLRIRNRFSREKSLSLWMSYNCALLHYQRRFGFDLICFDWSTERYHKRLTRIALDLCLATPQTGSSFFEPGLRKNCASYDKDLPEPVITIYRTLQDIAA